MPLTESESSKIKEIIKMVAADTDSDKIDKVIDLVTESKPKTAPVIPEE